MTYLAQLKGVRVSYLESSESPRSLISSKIRKEARIAKKIANALSREVQFRMKSSSGFKNRVIFIHYPETAFELIQRSLGMHVYASNIRLENILLHAKLHRTTVDENCHIIEKIESGLNYDGVPLTKVMAHRFLRFRESASELAACIDETERLVRRIKPDIVVVREDITPLYRVIIKVCRENGIPTLVIQHGIFGTDIGGFHVMPVEADKQAVWGKAVQEWAIKRGKLPETEVVTGNPRYDGIIRRDVSAEEDRSAVCRRLGLNSQMGIIVIASEWYMPISFSYTPEHNEAFIRGALTAVKEFPEKQVVVKLHPTLWREYMKITRSIVKDLQSDNVVITKDYLWELLRVCDLVVTEGLGVGLEALLFDKPVVTFSPGGQTYLDPYENIDAVIRVYRMEDLRSSIKDALYSTEIREKLAEARSKALYDNLYLQDGNASGRVADLIRQMISTSIN